jgi:exonuclease III
MAGSGRPSASRAARGRPRPSGPIGWRIDYALVSKALVKRVVRAEIHIKVMGSDHCPVSVTLKD